MLIFCLLRVDRIHKFTRKTTTGYHRRSHGCYKLIGYFFSIPMLLATPKTGIHCRFAQSWRDDQKSAALANALRNYGRSRALKPSNAGAMSRNFSSQNPGQQVKSALNGLSGLFRHSPPTIEADTSTSGQFYIFMGQWHTQMMPERVRMHRSVTASIIP